MANRNVYYVDNKGVSKIPVSFRWYPGFAKSQKQKSIHSLHSNFKKKINRNINIIEISSVSKNVLGRHASAFNLSVKTTHGIYKVEQLFQAGKVYKINGPQINMLKFSPVNAKKKIRSINDHDKLIGFSLFGCNFPLVPKTFFYDWIYVHGLIQNMEMFRKIIKYDAFTDIEISPKYTINSQAKSCAIIVSLYRKYGINNLKRILSIKNANSFKKIVYK